jgi:hypothetical protein
MEPDFALEFDLGARKNKNNTTPPPKPLSSSDELELPLRATEPTTDSHEKESEPIEFDFGARKKNKSEPIDPWLFHLALFRIF